MESPKSERKLKETKIDASQAQIGVVGDRAEIKGGIHYTIIHNYYPPDATPPTTTKPELTAEKIIPECPYRGLFAFRPEHAPLFFGRDTFTEKLVQATESRSLVAVLRDLVGGGEKLKKAEKSVQKRAGATCEKGGSPAK